MLVDRDWGRFMQGSIGEVREQRAKSVANQSPNESENCVSPSSAPNDG